MRFGKRHKNRIIREQQSGTGSRAAAAVAWDEQRAGTSGNDASGSDPTQQLLTILGRFQRELAKTRLGEGREEWTDECMNQLIVATELAMTRNWTGIFEALTDTGRVLQTYETAGTPHDALSFLDDAYELLCLMAGEIITDKASSEVSTRWKNRYRQEVDFLRDAGHELAEDDEDSWSNAAQNVAESQTKAGDEDAAATEAGDNIMPFEMPVVRTNQRTISPVDEELPTLEELPPLEDMLDSETDQEHAEEVANTGELETLELEAAGDASEAEATTEEIESDAENEDDKATEAEVRENAPTEKMVQIVDRICDELGTLEERTGDSAHIAVQTIRNGIDALKQEAAQTEYALLVWLCEKAGRATSLAREHDALDGRYVDLIFAFCGAYTDAIGDGESQNAKQWEDECDTFLADVEAKSGESTPQQTQDELVENEIETESKPNIEHVDFVSSAAPPQEVAPIEDAETVDAEDDTAEEIVSDTAIEEANATIANDYDAESALSQDLLMSAQRAASKGDGEGAKLFALQAAANIARVEVLRAERRLHETEMRLKKGLDSIQTARNNVKQAETAVRDAATRVANSETDLGGAKEHTAQVAQQLEDLQGKVAELERQIQELQKKRDQELQNVEASSAKLDEAREQETKTYEHFLSLQQAEENERIRLEKARQDVKDMQRSSTEVENALENARDALAREKASLSDIMETLNQLTDDSKKPDPERPAEEMLF